MSPTSKTESHAANEAPEAEVPEPQLGQALLMLCRQLLPVWERQLANSRTRADQAVRTMLVAFSELEPYLQANSTVGAEVQQGPALLQQIYTGLQYQDRIDQMLALLQDDVRQLHALIDTQQTDARALDALAWLARLESRYVMDDQRAGQENAPVADKTNETTYF